MSSLHPPPPSIGLGSLFVIALVGLAGVFALLLYSLGMSPAELVKAARRQWNFTQDNDQNAIRDTRQGHLVEEPDMRGE